MLGLGATVSSLNFTLGHRIDFLGSQVYFRITEVGEWGKGRGVGSWPCLKFGVKICGKFTKKGEKNLRSSGTTRGKNWAWLQGKRILLLSYEILRKKLGYLSSGQALPPNVEGPAGFLSVFLSSSWLLFSVFYEPTVFKLLERTQNPLHTHPSFPSTTSRSLHRVISTILRLCSNVISWHDSTAQL